MSFIASVTFSFGASAAGLTDLRCQPETSAGASTGAAITTGFVNKQSGLYEWTGTVNDDAVFLRGYSNGTPAMVSIRQAMKIANGNVAVANVTVGAYAAGQDPATLLLTNPTFKLTTDGNGRVAVNNFPVEFLSSAEQTELVTTINDLNALLGRTDTAGTVSTISANMATLLTRISGALTIANGKVAATIASGDDADAATIKNQLPAGGGILASQADVAVVANQSGTGARTVTLIINDGALALQGALVRLTKAAESFVATTDGSGHAAFGVNDGDWTVAITLNGYKFTPTTLTVSANLSHTYSMTLNAIIPPALPNQSNGLLTTCDASGVAAAGVVVTFSMQAGPGADGNSFSADPIDATSNGDGLLAVALVRGATYQGQRGDGQAGEFVVPDADSFDLPELLGRAS